MIDKRTPMPTLSEGGRVVKLVTDDELVINLGANHGVTEGMIFEILDPSTQDVIDPLTLQSLGSIERVKSQVRVIKVSQNISLAAVYPLRGRAGIGIAAQVLMEPKPRSATLTGDRWPDGVEEGDPVRYTKKKARTVAD